MSNLVAVVFTANNVLGSEWLCCEAYLRIKNFAVEQKKCPTTFHVDPYINIFSRIGTEVCWTRDTTRARMGDATSL